MEHQPPPAVGQRCGRKRSCTGMELLGTSSTGAVSLRPVERSVWPIQLQQITGPRVHQCLHMGTRIQIIGSARLLALCSGRVQISVCSAASTWGFTGYHKFRRSWGWKWLLLISLFQTRQDKKKIIVLFHSSAWLRILFFIEQWRDEWLFSVFVLQLGQCSPSSEGTAIVLHCFHCM